MRLRVFLTAAVLLRGCALDSRAQHEVSIPWSLGGHTIRADLHTHTRYSDGALTLDNLVMRAVLNGCNALAITDHGAPRLKAATPEFFAELDALRAKVPNLILLAGLEWNVPPYDGIEHVSLIVEPSLERMLLPEFKAKFDRGSGADADSALEWLARASGKGQIALFYNHPLRDRASSPERVERDLKSWRAKHGLLIGFEGAPGHQGSANVGNYRREQSIADRWDLTSAQIGGVWDRLLSQGAMIWGAIANSDFHNDEWDKEPCAFSETVLQVPERSHKGVLQALRAGTFWAGHGKFLRQLSFTVQAPGLKLPAGPGEIIRHKPDAEAIVRIFLERAPSARTQPLTVELIGNCRGGRPEQIAAETLPAWKSAVEIPLRRSTVGEDGSSCYVRARVRNRSADGDLLAYTNPIRLRLR